MRANNKQMRVFISSTFKDLNSERDYLMKHIFPELKVIAEKRGIHLIPLDLRWGITSEDTKNGKILEICLREIDYSYPYFIGILGDRYGWCPDETDYTSNDNLCKSYGKIQKYVNDKLSITEIEFMYAALGVREKMNAAFFLKKPNSIISIETPENLKKLKRLRRKVEQNKRYPAHKFTSKKQLGRLIRDYILDELNKICPENSVVDEYQGLKDVQQWYLNSLSENYIPNNANLRLLNTAILLAQDKQLKSKKGLSVIGSGCSSLLAYWINGLNTTDINIVYYFMCPGTEILDSYGIVTYILNQIQEFYNIVEDDFVCEGEEYTRIIQTIEELRLDYTQEWLDLYYKMMMTGLLVNERTPSVIVLDGITHLPSHELLLLLGVKCLTEEYFCYIVSEDEKFGSVFSGNVLKINPLTIKQRKQVITTYLMSYGKKLSLKQLYKLSHGTLTGNPKILRILLDELVIYGSYEGLDNFIDYYLSAIDEQTFYNYLFDRYENDYGKALVTDAVSVLKILEGDCLSEDELVGIIGTNLYNWACFFSAAKNQFEVVDGLIRMSFRLENDIIKERYILDNETGLRYRRQIVDYLKTKDFLQVDRYCKIMARQLYKIDDKRTLYQFLCQLPVYRLLRKINKSELGTYWYDLYWDGGGENGDYSPFTLFQQMVEADASADEFFGLADFVSYCDLMDKRTIVSCLYEAEKRYENQEGKWKFQYKALCDISYYVSDDNEAIDALQKALNVIDMDPKYDHERIYCYSEIARHYEHLSLFDLVIIFLKKAIMLITEENVNKLRYECFKDRLLTKLSEIYYNQENFEESLKYCNAALEYIQSQDEIDKYYKSKLIDIHVSIGLNAFHLKMYTDCRTNVEKAIALMTLDKEHDYSKQFELCSLLLANLSCS